MLRDCIHPIVVPGAAQHEAQRSDVLQTRDPGQRSHAWLWMPGTSPGMTWERVTRARCTKPKLVIAGRVPAIQGRMRSIRVSHVLAFASLFLLAACAGGSKGEAAKPARAVSSAKSEALVGKSPEALRAMLGEPQLLRRDQGAEVWQYAGESCVLFLYLYPNEAGAPVVSYVDARLKTKGPAPVPECLAEALRANKRGGGATTS